jgi:hypothetical protein
VLSMAAATASAAGLFLLGTKDHKTLDDEKQHCITINNLLKSFTMGV